MPSSDNCPICNTQMSFQLIGTSDTYKINCPRCGEYRIAGLALATVRSESISGRRGANIVGWLRQNQHHEITPENLGQMTSVTPPSFHERADLLLQTFETQTSYAGEYINRDDCWTAVSYCVNITELDEIISFLEQSGRVEQGREMGVQNLKICPGGWARLEELKEINPDSHQCFVAMWFDSGMQHVYDTVISEAIRNTGFSPHRVDQREHNDKIDDEIIAQIRKSRFVLSDFTGHRGGVYYEAGFAKGLGLEVIWTCRENDFENLHFDIRQFNCIAWKDEDLDDFKRKIQNRIEAVIGVGNI